MYDMANIKKLKTMKELAPEAMAGFNAFNEAVFKEGALSVKVKELIAVAAIVCRRARSWCSVSIVHSSHGV